MQAPDVGIKIRVHFDLVGIELQLRGVEQGLIGGEARHNLIHGLNKVDNVDHGAVGHGGGDIAGNGVRQRGADVGEIQFLLPGALAVQNVAEALHHDVPVAQHIGQLSHLLGVGDGLVEGDGEVVGAEDGHVGVLRLLILEGVAVDHGQVVVVVLLGHIAARVLAEGADLIFEGGRVADELGFVEDVVDLLHDLVAHFHPHADIDSAGLMLDAVLGAQALQPVRAPAAGGHHGVSGQELGLSVAVGQQYAPAQAVFNDEVAALPAEKDLHAALHEIVLYAQIDVVGLFGAHVADGAIHQLQPGRNGPAADGLGLFRIADALDMHVRAKFQIDIVHIVDGLLRLPLADERGQVAANLVAEGELAVRKSAGAGKTGGNVAVRLAVHALARDGLGAAAVLHRFAFFHQHDLLFAAFADHLKRRKDACGARADDYNVCRHSLLLFRTASTSTDSTPKNDLPWQVVF